MQDEDKIAGGQRSVAVFGGSTSQNTYFHIVLDLGIVVDLFSRTSFDGVTDGMRDEEKTSKCLAFDRQAMTDLVKQTRLRSRWFGCRGIAVGVEIFFSKIHRYLRVN